MKLNGGGRVSWSRADRERAKREKKRLVVLGFEGLDGQQMVVMGVAGEKLAMKIAELIVEASKKMDDE